MRKDKRNPCWPVLDAEVSGMLSIRTRGQSREAERKCRLAARLGISLAVCSLIIAMFAAPAAFSQIAVSVTFGPPALPIYAQPVCPGPGYIWTPGYWAWDPEINDYYWVPGTWVMAPFQGALWTPGYWMWTNGAYGWNPGYWGPVVGFYGGINYGFGYTGNGYEGGYWRRRAFFYNRSVNNVTNVRNITNVYNKTVINNVNVSRVSYSGGRGGIAARPTAAQLAAAHQRRMTVTPAQRQQQQLARTEPTQRASTNRGRPAVAATARPGAFSGPGVVRESRAGAPYRPPTRAAEHPLPTRTPNPAGAGQRPLVTAPGHAARPAPSERAAPTHRPAPQYGSPSAQPRPNSERPPVTRQEPRRTPEAARPAPVPRAAPQPRQKSESPPAARQEPRRPPEAARPAPGPRAAPQEHPNAPRSQEQKRNRDEGGPPR